MSAGLRNRPRLVSGSTLAMQRGEDGARADLAHCATMDDVAWYRQVAHDNLFSGTAAEQLYLVGYDHVMASAVTK